MKIPCEVVVWYVLPIIRREVASELVNVHGMTQAEVARKFGVTDAAISQYLKKKRGESSMIERSVHYPELMEAIREAAKNLAEDKAPFESEMCKVCVAVRRIGLLEEIYTDYLGEKPVECVNMCGTIIQSDIKSA